MYPSIEACGCISTLMGWGPFPVQPQRRLPEQCADREVFLDLRSGHLISLLQQSSASATSFVLGGVSGWEQTSVLLHLTNTSCPSHGPICLLISHIWWPLDCFASLCIYVLTKSRLYDFTDSWNLFVDPLQGKNNSSVDIASTQASRNGYW